MRVGIDCQTFSFGPRHGYSTYLGNLLRALRTRYPEHEFVNWTCNAGPGWRMPNQLWWDQVQVPWSALKANVDVIHTPAFSGPVLRHVPLVMTVMDLLYKHHPEWLPTRRARWYWRQWMPLTARRATAVIAPSEVTKRDLVSLAGIPPERITVIPLAVDEHFLTVPSEDQIRAYRVRRGLESPYILCVGSIDHRKDLLGLIRAYVKARSRLKTLRLVIAGSWVRGHANLREEIRSSNLAGDILLPGHVPDEELLLLYAGASAFVYPSWWEGFGIPPLEAMAVGIPVITYRSSSLPEVVDDAAILIDPPFTEEALESAMIQVLFDERTRADLFARGQRRVKAFSWERVAEQTMAVYERCSVARMSARQDG